MADNLDPQATTIDGVRYTVRPLAGMASFRMQNRLASIIAPAAIPLFAGDTALLPGAARDLFAKLTPDEQEEITRVLLDRSTADGKTLLSGGKGAAYFDEHFACRSHVIWELLLFAVKVNFAGGFDALVKRIVPLLASLKEKAESSSPSTSES